MPTIIFKETEACNSNCIYCDVVKRKKPKTISFELLQHVFQEIDKYLKAKPFEEIELIWHGGEPCIVGVEFYKKVLELQQNYCPETKSRITHAIQSNLTLITQEFIDVFKQMGIDNIGTSFEVFHGIRGFGKNRDSVAYNKAFFKGVNLLQKNNFGWGFIYVVTKKALENPLDIFYLLTNMRLSGGVEIHPVLIYNDGDDSENNVAVTPKEYADFLGEIFPVWWEHRDRYPDVGPFKEYFKNYTEDSISLTCNDSGRCAYTHAYLGPEGSASHCGRSADWDIISYGNIKERSLIEIFEDEQRKQFDKRTDTLPKSDCKDCEYWGICHGGCPLDSWNKNNNFMHKTEWCAVNKLFLKKYFEPITGLKPKFHYKKENYDRQEA